MQPHKQRERAFQNYLSKFKSKSQPIPSTRTFSFAFHILWARRRDCSDLQDRCPACLLQPRSCDLWAETAEHRQCWAASPAPLLQPPWKGWVEWAKASEAHRLPWEISSQNILHSHRTPTVVSPSKLCLAKNAPNPWKPPHLQDGSLVTVQVTCLWNLIYWVFSLRYPARY